MTNIDFIEQLIQKSKAYAISTEVGTFVCAEGHKFPNMQVRPVQYAILDGKMRRSTDFPIWAPYKDGQPSPFGNGQSTVNVHLIQ